MLTTMVIPLWYTAYHVLNFSHKVSVKNTRGVYSPNKTSKDLVYAKTLVVTHFVENLKFPFKGRGNKKSGIDPHQQSQALLPVVWCLLL